jgi:regulator of protease activity HflC (stomatin/prohibitin superfamily)
MVPILVILALLGLLYGVGGAIANKVSRLNQEEFLKAQQAGLNRGKQAPPVIKLPATLITGIISGIVFVLFTLFWIFIYQIDGQHVGVVTTPSGVKNEAIHTGWNVVMPWWDIHEMDKTVWVYTCAQGESEGAKKDDDAIWAPTSEGIKMGFDISASWRIDPNQAPWIFQNVTPQDGNEETRYIWLEENVIRTKLKSNLALTVSEYTPIQTYSNKRQEIQDKVIARMIDDLKTWRIILDQVDIREVYYDPEYEAEIKNKKVQEQKALTLIEVTKQKQELLTQAEIDKNIVIQTAQGEAEALKIKGEAINQNPKIITLEWIKAWQSGGAQVPSVVAGEGGGGTMFMMNIDGAIGGKK